MRLVLLGLLLIAASPAFADTADDYTACLVGQAAVALQKQETFTGDARAAFAVAMTKCPEPTNLPADIAIDGLIDEVVVIVEDIADR